jgi:hypothetical protein
MNFQSIKEEVKRDPSSVRFILITIIGVILYTIAPHVLTKDQLTGSIDKFMLFGTIIFLFATGSHLFNEYSSLIKNGSWGFISVTWFVIVIDGTIWGIYVILIMLEALVKIQIFATLLVLVTIPIYGFMYNRSVRLVGMGAVGTSAGVFRSSRTMRNEDGEGRAYRKNIQKPSDHEKPASVDWGAVKRPGTEEEGR